MDPDSPGVLGVLEKLELLGGSGLVAGPVWPEVVSLPVLVVLG